jgi:glycosyltransferase involved in cell wall biosynthesis
MPTLYLPNGVSPLSHQGRDNRQEISSSPRVLFFSRFVEVPPDWLARFWAALLALLPEAELAIAGEPVAPGLDEPFRRALATTPAVHWLGYVPSDNLRALYDGSACAIFPATPVPLHQAKCSVRLATTLLHGVPVVASAVGEQAVYGSAGAARLVAADAPPERFAQDVAQVLASPAQRIALQTAAQAQLLARYNWTLLVASLEEFYGSVCERQT